MEDGEAIRYMVRILPRALDELAGAAERFAELAGPEIKGEWLAGIRGEIIKLVNDPRRHPLIPEQKYFAREVRHFVYRRRLSSAAYRVLFTVTDEGPDGPLVRIFHIRHAATRPLGRKGAREIETDQE